jgi:hypothetical protein
MVAASPLRLLTPTARRQYGAVSRMRWQMLANSLRSRRGKFEFAARFIGLTCLAFIWIGASVGFGWNAWHLAAGRDFAALPLLLWPILVSWQLIPFMLAAFQEGVDLTLLLRFPTSSSGCLSFLPCWAESRSLESGLAWNWPSRI